MCGRYASIVPQQNAVFSLRQTDRQTAVLKTEPSEFKHTNNLIRCFNATEITTMEEGGEE